MTVFSDSVLCSYMQQNVESRSTEIITSTPPLLSIHTQSNYPKILFSCSALTLLPHCCQHRTVREQLVSLLLICVWAKLFPLSPALQTRLKKRGLWENNKWPAPHPLYCLKNRPDLQLLQLFFPSCSFSFPLGEQHVTRSSKSSSILCSSLTHFIDSLLSIVLQ